MKVTIGPYTNYNRKTKKTPERKISVKIDKYDTWNMDKTLSLIIFPMLVQMKKEKMGVPGSFLSEEYNNLVSSSEYHLEKESGPLHKKEKVLFKAAVKAWNDVFDKMIWSFKEISTCCPGEDKYFKNKSFDKAGYLKYNEKIQEGLTLFGTYYRNLWD